MRSYECRSRPRWKDQVLSGRLPSIFIMLSGLAIAVTLGIYATSAKKTGSFECAPDGTLILPDQTLTPSWSSQYFFSITLAWGDFNLSTAKIIDISWGLVIGRGGQLLLSLLVFTVLRRSAWASMERHPWNLPVMTQNMLDPVSFPGLLATVKDIRTEDQGRTQGLLGFVLVVIYILAFSTIVSAMTGYRSLMVPSYLQDEGTTQPLGGGDFKQVYALKLQNLHASCYGPECFLAGFPGCVVPPGSKCYDAWNRCRSSLKSAT